MKPNQLLQAIEDAKHRKSTRLDLQAYGITALPQEIGSLVGLERLDLRNNRISTLPPSIGNLRNLRVLILTDNQLSDLPETLQHLSNLIAVGLGGNRFTSFPELILRWKNLQRLWIWGNPIADIPKEIGDLSNLRTLEASNAGLHQLPDSLRDLANLEELRIDGNPELGLPPEICRNSSRPQEILNYYFRTRFGRPLGEAKMLVVGEGDVGKTSIVKRLLRQPFDPHEARTHGIETHQWPIGREPEEIRLNVWDFGGQEIMHATHQFFLTARSLYLMVIDSRHNQQQSRIEYWLKLIQTFGADSPVIVVCNKCDRQKMSLDWSGLRKKYPNIRSFARSVSCKTGEGIAELEELIETELSQLKHVTDLVPVEWFRVKSRMENLEENYLSFTSYQEICGEENISEEKDHRRLIGFLHDLGIVLHFGDHPILRDTSILNPRWVTAAVYRILNSNCLFQNHGVLSLEHLDQLLSDLPDEYPSDKQLFIMEIMRRFELCFEFPGKEARRFLIPDLLPLQAPDTGDWSDGLRLEIRYDILPSSVISRFIVRMHRLISNNTYWRKGVVLKAEDAENRALITADLEDRVVRVSVSGAKDRRAAFMGTIRDEFDRIHGSIPRVNAVLRLEATETPGVFVDYEDLIGAQEMGETELLIPRLRKRIDVGDALDRFNSRDVFISYAREDQEWLKQLKIMLAPIVQQGRVLVLSDEEIEPWQRWQDEIHKMLKSAQIAVLLVSASFLNSEFITKTELPYLIEAERNGLRLTWVLLSECLWEETPISTFNAAHDPNEPLDSLPPATLNLALKNVCKAILRAAAPKEV